MAFRCSQCKSILENESKFCPNCGVEFKTKEKVTLSPDEYSRVVPNEQNKTHTPGNKKCNMCGCDRNPYNSTKCVRCGAVFYNTDPTSPTENPYPYANNQAVVGRIPQQSNHFKRVCPYCGCDDLLYETAQKSDRLTLWLKILAILGFVIGLPLLFFTHPIIFIIFFAPIVLIFIITLVVRLTIINHGDKDGDLRIVCKNCGRRLNP